MKKVDMHARWDLQTINRVRGESIFLGASVAGVPWGGSPGGGLVDNHQPALGSMFGISGSSH